MRITCSVHSDFELMYNTATALNKVSRTIQDSKRDKATYETGNGGSSNGTTSYLRGQEIATTIHGEQSMSSGKQIPPQQPSNHQFQVPQLSVDLLHEMGPPMQNLISSQTLGYPLASDLFINDSTFEPLGLVRALETNFVGRNWHDSWWDTGDHIAADFGNVDRQGQ